MSTALPGGRAAAFSLWWAGCYTRGLAAEQRETRQAEIRSDLFEHVTDAQASGTQRGVAAAMVGRTLRGMGADVLWRVGEGRAMNHQDSAGGIPTGLRAAWATATQAWFTPAAVLVGLFNVVGAVAIFLDPNGKMPGQVIGPLVMLALAAGLFQGLRLRWRSSVGAPASGPRPSRGHSRLAAGVLAAIAVVAVVFGLMGSLFLLALGILALGGAAAVVARHRTGARSAPVPAASSEHVVLADVLIIVGTLPALGLWWMVFPAIAALVVIAGVIGTGPGTRRRVAV